MKQTIYQTFSDAHAERRGLLYLLIDPEKADASLAALVRAADAAGVDGFLVGGTLTFGLRLDESIGMIKESTGKPVVIFPGGVHQISGNADALLFLSLISGRNADQLIGQQVIAAPILKRLGLEAISTGYMLVESGGVTTAEFMSATRPIPRDKPKIAAAHALAAEYLGMKLVYLEAGSGAGLTVPDEMVIAVAGVVDIPLIVGGGIRTPEEAGGKIRAGATLVVVGNHFEETGNRDQLRLFAEAVHDPGPVRTTV